ncbi:ATP-binding cassette domain-containing protein [Tropicimonas sp.]|uniref:ATP-binding cassette domain-containing protein n=1 Tax=Tropicimonas sp. TaxID=2067044 RepID=UPI003A876FD2
MTNQRAYPDPRASAAPVLAARGLKKSFGRVVAIEDADFDLYPNEILAVIGDNGAGKSTMIAALVGALRPDAGAIWLNGREVTFRNPMEARTSGIETVFQTLAMAPSLTIVDNMFLGREYRQPGVRGRFFRALDRGRMRQEARRHLSDLGLMTIQNIDQVVETLSGGQRQGVAVARACAFGSKVVILDEPTAALGVRESARVLDLIRDVRDRGIAVVLISHNMPHVFEIADRVHIHRLGRRIAQVRPGDISMSDAVAIMTGAMPPPERDAVP